MAQETVLSESRRDTSGQPPSRISTGTNCPQPCSTQAHVFSEDIEFFLEPATLRPSVLFSTVAFASLLVKTLEYSSRLGDLIRGVKLSNKGFPSHYILDFVYQQLFR